MRVAPRRPKTGPRRTLQAALEGRKLPGLERRYPVLGPPSSPLRGTGMNDKCVNH